jgi:hypothetical protein
MEATVSGSVSSAGDIYDATGTLRVAGANMPGGSSGDVLTSDANGNLSLQAPAGGGGGTVTSVTVESANGLAGTVNDAETTPQITLSTTVTGLLKGNGTAVSAATAGTDYLAPAGSGASLTGITATQVGADASGAAAAAQAAAEAASDPAGSAATAQSNAETYAASQASAAQSAAEAASVPLSDLPLSVANGGSGTALQVPGATPFNPVMLAPVKWAFVNYDVAQYQLGATYSYSNGTAGVGATITAGANGVLSIDGGSPSVGDRVLVSDGYAHGTGNSPYVDGTYVVTSVGSVSTEWVLTRASDTNTAATLFQYWGVQITSGTQFGGGWGVVTALSGTAGTGPQTYAVSTSFLQMSIAGPSAWAAGTRCVAMGQQATAIGTQATAAANNAVAIGNTAYATGTASTAVGYTSKASGQQSIAIGSFCYAPARNSSAYGVGSSASSQNQEAFASGNSGPAGSQQHTRLCQYATTTSATPASLASSNSAALVLQTYQDDLLPGERRGPQDRPVRHRLRVDVRRGTAGLRVRVGYHRRGGVDGRGDKRDRLLVEPVRRGPRRGVHDRLPVFGDSPRRRVGVDDRRRHLYRDQRELVHRLRLRVRLRDRDRVDRRGCFAGRRLLMGRGVGPHGDPRRAGLGRVRLDGRRRRQRQHRHVHRDRVGGGDDRLARGDRHGRTGRLTRAPRRTMCRCQGT